MHKHKSVGKTPAKGDRTASVKSEDAEGKPLAALQDFVRDKLKNEDESEEKSI